MPRWVARKGCVGQDRRRGAWQGQSISNPDGEDGDDHITEEEQSSTLEAVQLRQQKSRAKKKKEKKKRK